MAMPDDLTTLICLFHTEEQADGALKDLHDAGLTSDTITVLGRKTPQAQTYGDSSLAQLGVPKRDLKHLQEGLDNGGVLVAVEAFGPQQKSVEDIFTKHKASKIDDQRTDEYTNYKKYKPETQEQPVQFTGSTGAPADASSASSSYAAAPLSSGSFASASPSSVPQAVEPAEGFATVEDALLTDEQGNPVATARVVHIYRRTLDDSAL